MKRVVACLVLAVALAACGSGESDAEFAPATTTTWGQIPTTCEVTEVVTWASQVVFEVSFTNTLASRSGFSAGVDVYRAGEWLGATDVFVSRVPPGVTAKAEGFVFDDATDRSDLPRLQCLAFDIRHP